MSDRRVDLEDLRSRLKDQLEVIEDPRDLAAVSRELRAVLGELDALPLAAGATPADELKRRQQELAKAATQSYVVPESGERRG